jgi:uncharacterized protein (TIGR04255 family)
MTISRPVDYERPPVVEVECGVQFDRINWPSVFPGVLWDAYEEFPTAEDEPAFPAMGPLPATGSPFIQMPRPETGALRTQLLSKDGRRVIQLQDGRFHFNWAARRHSDEYPHFDFVYSAFKTHLATLEEALQERRWPLKRRMYELGYANRLPLPEGPGAIGDRLVDVQWRPGKEFLQGPPIATGWNVTFELPDGLGRMRVDGYIGQEQKKRRKGPTEDEGPHVRLDLVARGYSAAGMDEWFEVAHEWIVRAFADLTQPKAQRELWGRLR